ncbi:MAG: band 7 protein [Alphaproteobacteria bacterium]|nr:band 7 protein [Alphaproteobacteria bacterium]
MAQITRLPFLRHLRGESSAWLVHSRNGRTLRSGRGLSFWFQPLSASISELPMDDRELPILFHGRSRDFQDVTVQAVVSWRVRDAEALAQRVDFTLDLGSGGWRAKPIEKLTQLITEQARQLAWEVLVAAPLQTLLTDGVEQLRERLTGGLSGDEELARMGLEIVAVNISALRPEAELERALQTPAREAVQQEADRATFERRALAVERERAIAENELSNRIALAKREEQLIAQRSLNKRRQVSEDAETARIQVEAEVARRELSAKAEAEELRVVEAAKVEGERARVNIYEDLPSPVLIALSAREFAGKLPDIEHLVISPDLLGPSLQRLAEAASSGAFKAQA